MAITALELYKRIARKIGLDPTITSFSESNESNDVLQDINEAYEDLLRYLPDDYSGFNGSGTITLAPSTRTYAIAADALNLDVLNWSINDSTNSYRSIPMITRDALEEIDPQYKTTASAQVSYAYLEPGNLLAFYPVPSAVASIIYEYSKAGVVTRVSATTDTFSLIPDKWASFIVYKAASEYELRKGFDAQANAYKAVDTLGEIIAEVWEAQPTRIYGKGFN